MTRGPALRTLPSKSDCVSQRLAGVAAAIADSREPKLIITPDLQMAPKAARCAGPVTSSAVMGATGRTWAPTHDTADCRSWPSFLGHRAGAPSLCLLRRLTLPLWLKKRLPLTIIKGTRFVESRAGNSQIVGRPSKERFILNNNIDVVGTFGGPFLATLLLFLARQHPCALVARPDRSLRRR